MELITASHVAEAMAGSGYDLQAANLVFASEEAEGHFIATASDIDVVRYIGAIAIAKDGEVNKETAKKFAKNRGFLSGIMHKIWTTLKNPGSILKIGAIAASIAMVGTALTFACKNPAQFGAISKKFAEKASAWCAQVGQLASKAISAGKKSGGRVKGFVLNRLASVVAKLKTLPALLNGAAAKGAQMAKQGAKQVGDAARNAQMRAGGALHRGGNLVQEGARKASNKVFKAGVGLEGRAPKAAGLLERASGQIVKHGSNLAGGMRKTGTNMAMRAIPHG